MTAIALDELVIEHRAGDRYPVMVLTDTSGNWVELFVRSDPREAFINLSRLGRETSMMQAALPPSSYSPGNPST